MRGFRIARDNAELVARQLDAIAAAAARTGSAPWVMAPMIATAEEALRFAELARERSPASWGDDRGAGGRAARRQDSPARGVPLIGTNDLAQYTMAADRMSLGPGHPDRPVAARRSRPGGRPVAGQATGKAGGRLRRGCCRSAAGLCPDRVGVTSLSAAASAVALVGAKLASVTLQQCRDAAEAVLATAGAAEAARWPRPYWADP